MPSKPLLCCAALAVLCWGASGAASRQDGAPPDEIPALIESLKAPRTQSQATERLRNMPSSLVTPRVAEALRSDPEFLRNTRARWAGYEVIAALEPQMQVGQGVGATDLRVQTLKLGLSEPSPGIRRICLAAFGRSAPDLRGEVAGWLVPLLRDDDAMCVESAARILGGFGPVAIEGFDELGVLAFQPDSGRMKRWKEQEANDRSFPLKDVEARLRIGALSSRMRIVGIECDLDKYERADTRLKRFMGAALQGAMYGELDARDKSGESLAPEDAGVVATALIELARDREFPFDRRPETVAAMGRFARSKACPPEVRARIQAALEELTHDPDLAIRSKAMEIVEFLRTR